MSELYADRRIRCTDEGLRIGAYYPWGAKTVAYAQIKGVARIDLTPLRGKLRIWGTGTFRYWANLDTKRPSKSVGLLLDLGGRISPFITPDDPVAVVAAIEAHSAIRASDGTPTRLL
jgi:hypothetical protein